MYSARILGWRSLRCVGAFPLLDYVSAMPRRPTTRARERTCKRAHARAGHWTVDWTQEDERIRTLAHNRIGEWNGMDWIRRLGHILVPRIAIAIGNVIADGVSKCCSYNRGSLTSLMMVLCRVVLFAPSLRPYIDAGTFGFGRICADCRLWVGGIAEGVDT